MPILIKPPRTFLPPNTMTRCSKIKFIIAVWFFISTVKIFDFVNFF